jgi:hypothetical protein
MAARSAGSGRTNLAFVRAARWRDGATILGQDCTLSGSSPSSIQLGMPRTGMTSTAASTQGGLLQTGGTAMYGLMQPGSEGSRICRPALGVTSVVPRNASALSASGPRVAYNVVLEGQPFAITGDTVFTTVPLGGGAEGVQVLLDFLISCLFFARAKPKPTNRSSAWKGTRRTCSA